MKSIKIMWDVKLLVVALVAASCIGGVFNQFVGGLSEEREADEEVELALKKVKVELEQLSPEPGPCADKIIALRYRKQVVAGINYFVKIMIPNCKEEEDDLYAHVKIFRDLKDTYYLSAIKVDGIKKCSPIEYFY